MVKSKFSNEDLSRWKQEINPAPIIGKRISLNRENAEYVAVCPFHPDKNPSFKVYKLDAGVWGFKCFGCGENGNVFQFVQKFDNISFTAAVTKVLEEAGVAGWQDGDEQIDTSIPEREVKETVTFSMAQYAPAISALERSPKAHEWLQARGIGAAVAHKFCLGFVQSAETITSTNAWTQQGWIMFPTLSADRQTVIAVKYRSLVAKKAMIAGKENSGILRAPNTSTTLFNLQEFTPKDDVWICEGEPDTVVLAQAGLTAVGYPMAGYKPTDDECDLLSSAKRRFLAGDGDAVGQKAMDALAKRLRGVTYVIKWPNNRKDANDVLTNECGNDPAKFKALVEDLKDRVTQTESISVIRRADEIAPKIINWLWPERIPLGKMTLFAGNPDNGKSLASTSVAAITSTGGVVGETPFTCKPSDVLMLIGEDDADDTAVPRLMSAHADLSRIHFLEAVRPVHLENREVRLDMDIPAIESRLAANPNIRLLIIDPISNYLGEVSMIAEQEVRSILIPLKRVAEKHNIAVVIVMHLNKKNDLDAISRVGGAMAFIGVARCSWLFARNVQEETEGEDVTPAEHKRDTFSMLRIKNNLVSSSKAGLAYSVAVRPISIEGQQIMTPYVIWGQTIEGSADDALGAGRKQSTPAPPRAVGRPNTKLQAAITWLEETLQDNQPRVGDDLIKDAKKSAGISEETLRRAYEAIGGVKPFKSGRFWYWQWEPLNETSESEGETPPAK